ncbi:hypothetical protein [Tabrizicola sp.]|uniref:hypothetical protein n=1 Tax=Tabrizicola sp. TaxID=2005166 RepID=UPI003F2DD13E
MIERLVFRFMPWWVFALFALVLLPLTFGIYTSSQEEKAELEAMRAAPQPPMVTIASFDPAQDIHPLGEVHLNGIWRSDLGVIELEQKGVNHSYLLLSDEDAASGFVVLHFPSYQLDTITGYLRANTDAAGRVAVGGFLVKSSSDVNRVEQDLMLRGLETMAVVEPFTGDRIAAIDEKSSTENIVLIIMAVMNGAVALVALVKFRAWRARVAARRPQPASVAEPAAVAKPAATKAARPQSPKEPPKNDFTGGPIVSKKGFFR